ncbi:MAG: hypothetical protein NVV74_07090 [Magnetospirillum sp.]|nr:hypothetical protein [Magnetospirillum sp.]
MEEVNFVSLPVVVALALVGGPLLLRRAGYPVGKTVFGTLTGLVALLGLWGILSTVQRKAGLDMVPLGWLVPVAAVAAAWRLRGRL